MRFLWSGMSAVLLLLSLGCSAHNPPSNARGAFTLRVMDESKLQSGEIELDVRETDAQTIVELRVTDAVELRELYFVIEYDAARYSPDDVSTTGLLGADALELVVLSVPGSVHCGQATVRDAFSGNAVAVRMTFDHRSFTAGRTVCVPPSSNGSTSLLSYDEDSETLRWLYYNQGDYDQNREVNGADLAPIAARFLTAGGPFDPESGESTVDGDNNGEINGADIAPIAGNFLRAVRSYNVYAGTEPDVPATTTAPSTLTPIGNVAYEQKQGTPGVQRLFFTFDLEAPDADLVYWVRPVDGTAEGTPSTRVSPAGGENMAPSIVELFAGATTLASGETTSVTAIVNDPDGDPLSLDWTTTAGSIVGEDLSVTFQAPVTDSVVVATISLTIDDGNGGTDQDSIEITVLGATGTLLDRVELDPGVSLSGSGTEADPFIVVGNYALQLLAFATTNDDVTAAVAWSEDSATPATAFSTTTAGLLHVNPFDGQFTASAELDGVVRTLYFQVQAPE